MSLVPFMPNSITNSQWKVFKALEALSPLNRSFLVKNNMVGLSKFVKTSAGCTVPNLTYIKREHSIEKAEGIIINWLSYLGVKKADITFQKVSRSINDDYAMTFGECRVSCYSISITTALFFTGECDMWGKVSKEDEDFPQDSTAPGINDGLWETLVRLELLTYAGEFRDHDKDNVYLLHKVCTPHCPKTTTIYRNESLTVAHEIIYTALESWGISRETVKIRDNGSIVFGKCGIFRDHTGLNAKSYFACTRDINGTPINPTELKHNPNLCKDVHEGFQQPSTQPFKGELAFYASRNDG